MKHFGYSVLRRSKMGTEEDDGRGHQVIILDTIGELGRLYSLADVVFVGGSFVKVGGHNILEPAAHGKPVLVGPYMFNFREIFDLLSKRGVCCMAQNESELEKRCGIYWLIPKNEGYGEAALSVVAENQGATKRNVDTFAKLAEKYKIDLMENTDEY